MPSIADVVWCAENPRTAASYIKHLKETKMSEARDMQKAAIIMARAAELEAKVLGMHAENMSRVHRGESLAYLEKDFDDAVLSTGCHWNSVCELLQGY